MGTILAPEKKELGRPGELRMNLENMAKIIIMLGLGIVVAGVLLYLLSRLGINGWRLPGDIYIRRGNFSFYFPLATCILLSIVLTLIFSILGRR